MLDAFIIERIRRREQERERSQRIPLHIEVPMDPGPTDLPRPQKTRQETDDSGLVDFSI